MYVEEGEQEVCMPVKKGRRGYELREEGKSGKERRRREEEERRREGEGTKHGGWRNRDREMYTCACVFFLCVCAEGYVHVDV